MSTWLARGKRARPQVSRIVTLPAPTGGWNQRDAISAMEPTDAVALDNWIPTFGGIRIRRGFDPWATALSGNYVETLMSWTGPSSAKLFAATPTIIYDVTAQAAGSSSVTSMTNGRWSDTMFSSAAGNYLYICNGADTPRYYNGSAWTNSTFTGSGLTITNLDFVLSHMNRLWFIEKNTLNAWYGDTSAIAGTLTKFIPPFRKGGKLVALGSWSRDGGAGPDDHLVFLTSTGECAVYAGTDPASASTMGLIGVYPLPEPIGRRCLLPVGSDLCVLTSSGIEPLSGVLGQSASGAGQTAITNKISGAFASAYRAGGTLFGWQAVEYPKASLAIFNIPSAERSTQAQFVVNTATGAWTRFTGINAGCWRLFGDALFFGGNDGKVYKFDVDYNDNGSGIVAILESAFSTFGSPSVKQFQMARPMFISPPSYAPQISLKTDYDTSVASLTVIATESVGSAWDTSSWDTSDWEAASVPSLQWQSVQAMPGVAASVAFAVSSKSELVLNGVDLMMTVGGPL